MQLNSEILSEIGKRYTEKGSSFRIKHSNKRDGSVCTEPHKSPAMIVTKLANGWIWHCHRCLDNGFIADEVQSPEDTTKKIADIAKSNLNDSNVVSSGTNVTLPTDFQIINNIWQSGTAHKWLLKAQITQDLVDKYEIGWSNNYKRTIVPVFELDNDANKVLSGWIGRNDVDQNKSKYYTMKSTSTKRLYYWAPNFTTEDRLPSSMDTIILVEDCLSSIVVYESTGICTVALLTTSVDDEFILKYLKDAEKVLVWLDADALAKSVKIVSKLRQMNINAHQIYTTKDPKCYNNPSIKEILTVQ